MIKLSHLANITTSNYWWTRARWH